MTTRVESMYRAYAAEEDGGSSSVQKGSRLSTSARAHLSQLDLSEAANRLCSKLVTLRKVPDPCRRVEGWRESGRDLAFPAGRRRMAGPAPSGLSLCEVLLGTLGDRPELDRGAGHLAQQLVSCVGLALGPQLTQERAGLAVCEPLLAVALPQVGAELGFERPRAQVRRGVEAGIHVHEIAHGARLDLECVREELDLVQELGGVPPDHEHEHGRLLGGEVARPRHVETPLEPRRLADEMLE